MNKYKRSFGQNKLNKTNAIYAINHDITVNDTINDENRDLFEQFNQICPQFCNCIHNNDLNTILFNLEIIQKSVELFRKSCLQNLLHFHIYELIAQLLDHKDNEIKISACMTVSLLFQNLNEIIQFFYQINDFPQLLFQIINTCNNIDGIYYGLYSLFLFFKKYYKTNPDLFLPQLSIGYLHSIYQQIEENYTIDDQESYKKVSICMCFTLFYKKLCKFEIDQEEYEIVIPFILEMLSIPDGPYEDLYPDLFKTLSNLISYDNMPIEDFFQFLPYVKQEIIFDNSESNIKTYGLLESIFNKGLQVINLIEILNKDDIQLDSESQSTFDKLIECCLDSIENHRSRKRKSRQQKDEYAKVSAAATKMLTSAIRNDDDMIIITNFLITEKDGKYGFLSIVNNLCNYNSIFALTQASSYCLMEILSRVTQQQKIEMNNIICFSRENDENSSTMYRSLIFALITIATMDDENLVLGSLNLLNEFAHISSTPKIMSLMAHDYFSADGFDKMQQIEEQNDNSDIYDLCESIIQFFRPKITNSI